MKKNLFKHADSFKKPMTAEHEEAAHATERGALLRTTTTGDGPDRGPADGPGTSIETEGTTADQPSRAQGDTVPPPTGGQARTQDAPPDYVYGSPPRHCRTNTPSTPVPELQLLQPIPRIQVRPPSIDVDTGAERPPVRRGSAVSPPDLAIFLKPDGIPSPFPPLSVLFRAPPRRPGPTRPPPP